MYSDRIKKIALVVLVLIAIIIWIKNLNLFEKEANYYQLRESSAKVESPRKKETADVEYNKPKLNPFVLPQPRKTEEKDQRNQKTVKSPEIVRISEKYQIDGLVEESENPQAVLRATKGAPLLVSVGDSLEGWQVKTITGDFIIFLQGKIRDTLFLQK